MTSSQPSLRRRRSTKGVFRNAHKKLGRQAKIIIFILIPVCLYFIPVNWLEQQHSVCLFKNLTGKNCYGCGITRAILSAMHFQFDIAYKYNKLIVIILPILIYIWTKTLIEQLVHKQPKTT
jgi:hypothetical protein